MLKIVHTPHPVLNKVLSPVKKFDQSLQKLIDDMIKTLEAQDDPPGVGLAGNQVGMDLSLFIMKPSPSARVDVCINPTILSLGELHTDNAEETNKLEGCLSIPRMWAPVRRHKTVTLEYQTREGVKKTTEFTGFKAIIVQHEMDHLHGVLFVQRALEQNHTLYKEVHGELKRTKL